MRLININDCGWWMISRPPPCGSPRRRPPRAAGRSVLVVEAEVLVDGETELDHAVDAAAEGVGLVEGEARGEQRGLEEEEDEILDGLVALVRVRALARAPA